jgi:hypothetical protein
MSADTIEVAAQRWLLRWEQAMRERARLVRAQARS